MTSANDASLVARARTGHADAFEALVERHQRRLYALALRVLHDHDQADEATQRAFVRAWERLRTFRGEASFATWLHHIAMNECRDILREGRRRVSLDAVPGMRLATGPDAPTPVGRRLGALVADLPPRQRTVLSLRVFGELPFADIAQAEGITENAAKVSFHHAVRRLAAWLGGPRAVISLACRRLRPALVDLALGAHAPDDARAIETHLADCATCRADLEAMRGLSSALRDQEPPLPPEDFWGRQRRAIMRRVRAASAASDPRVWGRRLKVAGALASVMLTVFVARMHVEQSVPGARHAIDRLDDDALFHLHDLLPALAPATAIDDADGDLLAVHDLADDELDRLDEEREP